MAAAGVECQPAIEPARQCCQGECHRTSQARRDAGIRQSRFVGHPRSTTTSLSPNLQQSNQEFDQWVHRCNLSDEAKSIIEHIRSSPPARRAQSRSQNVRGHFNRSRKMALTIQYESRTVELPAILLMELDDDVIEIWDQPPSFIINYKDAAGRNRGHFYTADFFVLRQHSAGWEEWKTEE